MVVMALLASNVSKVNRCSRRVRYVAYPPILRSNQDRYVFDMILISVLYERWS
jgi:hypothetical protein